MPYNPGISNQAGIYLADGIGSAGESLGGGIEKYLERRRKENDNADLSEKFFKTNPEALNSMGLNYDEFKGGSAKDKVNYFQTYMTNKALAERDAKQQQMLQEMAYRSALTDQMKASTANLRQQGTEDDAVGRALQGYASPDQMTGQAPDPSGVDVPMRPPDQAAPAGAAGMDPLQSLMDPTTMPRPMTQQERIAKALNTPGLGGRTAVKVAEALAKFKDYFNPTPADQLTFSEDDKTGYRFARLGKSIQSSGINPEKINPTATPVLDEDGNPTGQTAFNPGGKGTARLMPQAKDDTYRNRKLGVDTLVESEKALQGLEDNISSWHMQNEKSKTDKNRKAPDPEQLKSWEKRRDRLQSLIEDSGGGAAAAPASGTGTGKPGGGLDAAASRAAAADAIQRKPAARAAILQRLRAAGISTDGL